MFHPLLENLQKIKDIELEAKITDLTKKHGIAARLGQGGVCNQIVSALETYKEEQHRRNFEAMQALMKKNKNLDDLINID